MDSKYHRRVQKDKDDHRRVQRDKDGDEHKENIKNKFQRTRTGDLALDNIGIGKVFALDKTGAEIWPLIMPKPEKIFLMIKTRVLAVDNT